MTVDIGEHKINPFLAYMAYFLVTKCVFPIKEYGKENLKNSSYIFAPNHTNNFDGYILWSLLAKNYNVDSFMYKEFWIHFPKIAKVLPLFNVFPITRDKLVLSELKDELEKLKSDYHSLIIFPQGRHVNPKVVNNLFEYSLNTIPLGAFYIAAKANKPLVPIFIETSSKFKSNVVIYGKTLYPEEFGLVSTNKVLSKEKLMEFRKAWLEEIDKLYMDFFGYAKRKPREYKVHEKYTDATGINFRMQLDPNCIINYMNYINLLKREADKTGLSDLFELGKSCNISDDIMKDLYFIKDNYERNLKKN